MALEAIKALHVPEERFRISPASYPAGVTFRGSSRAGRIYVLSGACRYVFGDLEFNLQAGSLAEVPEGGYGFETVGSVEVRLVRVYELPLEFWPSDRAA
jgi:hypothetical protein